MASRQKSSADEQGLISAADALRTLLQRFLPILKDSKPVQCSTIPDSPPEPLAVLHSAATLLKAHTTKLSLLVLNKPYTPSAIRTVISEISVTCIPTMMSAVELCVPETYSRTLHDEVKARVWRVFKEFESMMDEVLSQARSGSGSTANGASKNQLASTGVVWESCDAVIALKDMGLVGLVVKKAQSYRELLEDAIMELKEWGDDAEDEGFDEGDQYSDDDMMFAGPPRLPADREDLRLSLDTGVKRLKVVSSAINAVTKRRLQDFKSTPSNIVRLDKVIKILKNIPVEADEMAGAYYELRADAKDLVEEIITHSKEVAVTVRLSWDDTEDDFTKWTDRWLEILDKTK